MKILLDYFFPITAVIPTPAASTAFLKQVLVVVKPKSGVTGGTVELCTSMAQVAAITDNTEAQELFNAGMSRVYVLAVSDLAMATILSAEGSKFFTVLISSDFTDANVAAMTLGTFKGIVGMSTTDDAVASAQSAIENRTAFHTTTATKAKNLFYAFGKLLSASGWKNEQFISMPYADDVDSLGEAENFFDDRVSFVISDDEFANRLGLFAAGGKAIAAPYIIKNLSIDMQSSALQYVTANQPGRTLTEAALLQDELEKVLQEYIDDGLIESGSVAVTIGGDEFEAQAAIEVPEPTALWRIIGTITQTT